MKKTTVVFLAFSILSIVLTGCKEKLVSETCVLCGAATTINYTSPQSSNVTISMGGGNEYTLRPGETVSSCDTHYGIIEMMVGKSK